MRGKYDRFNGLGITAGFRRGDGCMVEIKRLTVSAIGFAGDFIRFYEDEKEHRFEESKKTFCGLFPDIENFRLVPQFYGPRGQNEDKEPDAYRLEFDPKWKQTEFFHHLSRGTRGISIKSAEKAKPTRITSLLSMLVTPASKMIPPENREDTQPCCPLSHPNGA